VIDREHVAAWLDRYIHAWTTNDSADIAALFTEDAEYYEVGYDTEWIGRAEIVEGWQSRFEWQAGGWSFDWTLAGVVGDTAAVTGTGHYTELGDFDNIWTITFEGDRCSVFRMWNGNAA